MKKTLTSLTMLVFNISLIIFMGLGTIIVLVQLFSIITVNGPLSVTVYDSLKIWAIRASAITAFASFIMTYLKANKSN